MPRVSVLIPFRDAEGTLGASIRSIARQTLRDFECVLVDDASRDGSSAIAHAAATLDPRFRVVHAAGQGLVAALERGVSACRAPLIARLDADDIAHRTRLDKQAATLETQPGWAGVGSHVRVFPRPLSRGMARYERWLNGIRTPTDVAREAFVECPLAHPTWMLRSEPLRRLGYRDAGWAEDYDLVLRMIAEGATLGVVPEPLVSWRDSPGRLSRTAATYEEARFVACKAHFLSRGVLAKQSDYVLWGHGPTGRALRRALEEEGRFVRTVIDVHPRRIGNEIRGARVEPPEFLARGHGDAGPIVVSVAGSGPRNEIRATLAAMGYRETRDFVCAA